MRTFTFISSAALLLACASSQEIAARNFEQNQVEIDRENDFEASNTNQIEKDYNSEHKEQDKENFQIVDSHDDEHDFKQSQKKFFQGSEVQKIAKGRGKNIRKVGVCKTEEQLNDDKLVEKFGGEKNFRNKEQTNECVEEVEHENMQRVNKDAKSKKNKYIKRRADKKGFNLACAEGKGEKMALKRNALKNKSDFDSDKLESGERFGADQEKVCTKVNKRSKEVEIDDEGKVGVKVSKDRSQDQKLSVQKKVTDKDSVQVEKDNKFAAKRSEEDIYERMN